MLFLYLGVGLDNSFANPVRTEKKQPQRFLLGHFPTPFFEEILCQMKKNYLVLARKYRPKKLADIIGQEEICSVIEGSIKLNRVAHAFLFPEQEE